MESKPHLLVIAQAAHRLGGVPVWLAQLLPELQKRGWRPRLGLVESTAGEAQEYRRLHPGVASSAFAISASSTTLRGRRLALERTISRERPDLVLVSDVVDAYPTVADLRYRGEFGGRAAMALHGLHAGYFKDLLRNPGGVDSVVCSNRLTTALAAELSGLTEERILYAQYGAREEPEKERVGCEGAQLRIGWIGRLEDSQKGCLELPRVAAALVEREVAFEILVAGDGPDRERLEEAFKKRDLWGRISMAGEIPPSDVGQRVYSQIDLLLITSRWETGPLIAFEAMARGVPVVAARFLGSRAEGALVHGENCLLYECGNEDGAARAIALLCAREVRGALVLGGRKLVRGKYSTTESAGAWERALLRSLELAPRDAWAAPESTGPAGRLDRWLGDKLGERLRGAAGILMGRRRLRIEWPFTASAGENDAELWRLAEVLEARGTTMTGGDQSRARESSGG